MSANGKNSNRSRKRKPDQTFKYVQQDKEDEEETEGKAEKVESSEDVKETPSSSISNSPGGSSTKGQESEEGSSEAAGSSKEPPEKKANVEGKEKAGATPKTDSKVGKEQADDKKSAGDVTKEENKKDPLAYLSADDRKLLETNNTEFLKRFAPKYFVPVYKTWTIPKST